LLESFIAQRSGQDDRLPGDVFFELLGRLEPLAKVPEPSPGSGSFGESGLLATDSENRLNGVGDSVSAQSAPQIR